MRGFKRALAASGVALAAFSLTGTATAVADPVSAQVQCATDTDGHTWAWAVCATDRRYRVVVDYCRVTCSREYGSYVHQPQFSEVKFPAGGSIVVQAPQIE